MDKITQYQQAILDFLLEYATEMYGNDPSGVKAQVIADKDNHHYLLTRVGWTDKRQVYYTPFHFDIQDGKVWIQINNTEEMVADELIKRGVPATDIVLAFHPESLRKYTGFATA